MKIKCLMRFKHSIYEFLKDVIYEVDDDDGAYFVEVGFAEAAPASAVVATTIPELDVDPDTIYGTTGKKVFKKEERARRVKKRADKKAARLANKIK